MIYQKDHVDILDRVSNALPFQIPPFLRRDQGSGPQRAFVGRSRPPMTIYEVAEKVTKITLLKVHARIPVKRGILAK